MNPLLAWFSILTLLISALYVPAAMAVYCYVISAIAYAIAAVRMQRELAAWILATRREKRISAARTPPTQVAQASGLCLNRKPHHRPQACATKRRAA